jgi:Uma2 family endonuclease
MVTTKLATADDLAAIPDDGFHRCYLLRGEIRKMPPAGEDHGRIAGRVVFALHDLQAMGLGEILIADTGYFLEHDPDTVLAPDAAFMFKENLRPLGEGKGFARATPVLVVEVVSPSNTRREVMEKIEAYREAGVRLIWVAFPETKSVLVDGAGREPVVLTEQDTLDGADVLPNLRPLRVADLFR